MLWTGSASLRDVEGFEHLLGNFEVDADDAGAARQKVLDEFWCHEYDVERHQPAIVFDKYCEGMRQAFDSTIQYLSPIPHLRVGH